MNNSKRPDYTEEELGVNPFVSSLVVRVNSISTREYVESEGILLPKDVLVEKAGFTKVFCSSEDRKIVNNLSDKAKCLFLWVVYELEDGKDYLWVNKSRYMQEVSVKSYTTYANSVKELTRYGFIVTSTVKDVYWINPAFIFKGNRVKKFKDNTSLK